jgi:DNA-binding phage protein
MARRSRDWVEEQAKDLRVNAKHRHDLFLGCLEDGMEWREAINLIVKVIGVNEYAELVGDIKPSNLINQLKPDRNITMTTLEKIIKPLGIKITFVPKSAAKIKKSI